MAPLVVAQRGDQYYFARLPSLGVRREWHPRENRHSTTHSLLLLEALSDVEASRTCKLPWLSALPA